MYTPPRQQFPNNAIAWALLSQTVWLPLLAIDLHDRWQAQLREVQDIAIATAAAAKSPRSTTANPHTNAGVNSLKKNGQINSPSTTGILLGSSSQSMREIHGLSSSLTESARGSSAMANPRTLGNQISSDQYPTTKQSHQARSNASVPSSRLVQAQVAVASNPAATIRFETPWVHTFNKAELLGGGLGLSDLNTTMPPLAMAERARWSGSGDPLAPLPSLWREPMRKALQSLSSSRNEKPRDRKSVV